MENILKLKGVLDFKKFKSLNDTQIKQFLINHANEVLPVLVKPDYSIEPEENAMHEYHVTSEYILINTYYNNHGAVIATLIWSRDAGTTLMEYKIIK